MGTSGFYVWRQRPESSRSQDNRRLLDVILAVHHRSRQTYGSPRVHADLKAHGYACGKYRVAQLMRRQGLVSRHRRRFKETTNSNHRHPVAANHLKRRFAVSKANVGWVSDITSIPTQEGGLYLAVTLDLCHRKVVGWAMDRRPTQHFVIEAFTMAVHNGRPSPGLLHHSDRGVQYASQAFQARLQAAGVHCSMSRKGN